MIFTDRVEKFIPPRKGIDHVLRVVREALYFKPKGKGTDITAALKYFDSVTPRRAVTFIISDFLGGDYRKALSIANKKHDVVALTIQDPREIDLPDAGIVGLLDAEKGSFRMIDTSNARIRETYSKNAARNIEERSRLFASVNVDHIDIRTDKPYIEEFVRFFKMRKRRL